MMKKLLKNNYKIVWKVLLKVLVQIIIVMKNFFNNDGKVEKNLFKKIKRNKKVKNIKIKISNQNYMIMRVL